MKRIDYNCFTGNWPFHKVRCNTIEKLSALHRRAGIAGGIVSSLEAIFYQDPYEAEKSLAAELKGTGYLQAMVLNPMLPGWKEDLQRGINELSIKAVRLLPGFHNYHLTDPVMDEVADALRTCHLPLLLTLRLEDERITWMVHPRQPGIEEITAFLQRYSDLPTLLCNIRLHEIEAFHALLTERADLFLDTSGLKDGLFAIEKLWQTPAPGHLVYGSLAPLFELQSTALLVDTARILTADREAIFCSNRLNDLLF